MQDSYTRYSHVRKSYKNTETKADNDLETLGGVPWWPSTIVNNNAGPPVTATCPRVTGGPICTASFLCEICVTDRLAAHQYNHVAYARIPLPHNPTTRRS